MDRKKLEAYCSTGQNPQRAVVPMEEEEEEEGGGGGEEEEEEEKKTKKKEKKETMKTKKKKIIILYGCLISTVIERGNKLSYKVFYSASNMKMRGTNVKIIF